MSLRRLLTQSHDHLLLFGGAALSVPVLDGGAGADELAGAGVSFAGGAVELAGGAVELAGGIVVPVAGTDELAGGRLPGIVGPEGVADEPSTSPWCFDQKSAIKQMAIHIEAVTTVIRVNTSPAFAPNALEPPMPPSAPAKPPPRPRCTSTRRIRKIARKDKMKAKRPLIVIEYVD